MILHCYIILETGEIILKYTPKMIRVESVVDEELVSGFLGSVTNFMKQVSGQKIEMIQTEDFRWHFKQVGRVYLIMVTDFFEDIKKSQDLISVIGRTFVKNFGETSEQIDKNSEDFESFNEKITTILDRTVQASFKEKISYIVSILQGLKRISLTDEIKTILTALENFVAELFNFFPVYSIWNITSEIEKVIEDLRLKISLKTLTLEEQVQLMDTFDRWQKLIEEI